MISLVRRLPLLACLLALACGRSWVDPLEAAGQGTSSGLDEGGSATRGGPDEGDAEVGDDEVGTVDGDPTGDRECVDGPGIRWLRFYDGAALRTLAGDLERGPDGTLYMGGTRAGPDDMELWIAAAAPDGAILWEHTTLPMLGGNLAGWVPIAEDLVLAGDELWFAGSSYDGVPVAWHGRITTSGELLEAEPFPEVTWYGAALADDASLYLAGRNYTPGGALLVHYADGRAWGTPTAEASDYADINAAVIASGDAFVAGRRGAQAWIGRFEASSPLLLWDHSVLETATFPAEGGGLWAIASTQELVAAGGDVRLTKPTSTGHVVYNEIYLAAWSPDGEARWSWQRSADELYGGTLGALAVGPDGTIYATGREGDALGEELFFAAAFSPDGQLSWVIDERSHGRDERLLGLHGRGLVVGDDGQLFVLADRRWVSDETTALLEICG
jgi:hypothetical protein